MHLVPVFDPVFDPKWSVKKVGDFDLEKIGFELRLRTFVYDSAFGSVYDF
jgi:hypothetical protein